MGSAESKPRKVTVENSTIFISDELRERLSTSGHESDSRPSDAERSSDEVRPGPSFEPGVSHDQPSVLRSSVKHDEPHNDDRMSLGEETALALLRMRQEKDKELSQMQAEYFAKIKKAEEDFAAINKLKDENYTSALKETKEIFIKPRMAACQDTEQQVLDCYKQHASETLKCFSLVEKFHDCVATKRVQEALAHKTVPVSG